MEFNEEHKVKIETLNYEEAQAFIDFLSGEKSRHNRASRREMQYMRSCDWMLEVIPSEYGKAMKHFHESAIKRHEEDIQSINEKIKQVRLRVKEMK